MIVDFTFKNFRSFRDEAMLSLHAEHPKNNLLKNIAYPSKDDLSVLRSAVIYGPNASGKSNILLALSALKFVVCETHSFPKDRVIACYEPYLLSEASKNEPTEMELEFVIEDGKRFRYKISFTDRKVVSESLDYFPNKVPANIFDRKPEDTWETVNFGGYYKGGSKRIPFFDNNSYLSKAGNSAASPKLIRDVYEYFSAMMVFDLDYKMPIATIYQHEAMLKFTSDLLKYVDVGVSGITKQEKNFQNFPPDMPNRFRERFIRENKYEFMFHHKNDKGEDVLFRKTEESEGTQKLFSMFPAIVTCLKIGGVLVMDELENSFHPHIAEILIKIFNDPDVNVNNAQLIFTTHNIELMSHRLFRRDQIWFTSKDNGHSTLYSLDEFDKSTVTTTSPFGDWYADGRFGAVPHVKYKDICNYLVESLDLRGDQEKHSAPKMEEEE
ncbi:AAA family ATPase [Pseudomonas aeruginosa]|nr:AAA family ATPase [Pseudomonas aeruginosa]EKT7963653.1 AAA family ATPase [Pseudomonas aeruginosa]HCE6813017.1 AAA family ATPase [Pseudomonas aeruginosa]HCK4589916.1 AAA family ATPase [Pseudomonas aeruginosa]